MAERILVLGGYGVFGGRLARRLVQETDAEIIVAGRSLAKAEQHCRSFGGTPVALDRDRDLATALAALRPRVVIDAAGPFQAYGQDPYRVARAALASGAHYLDLSDDADFVSGIGGLDSLAREAGVAAISGASSVPAISSAALDSLAAGLSPVDLVGSAIFPGNRAPRGLSVVRAIAEQAGQTLKVWRGGRWTEVVGWGDCRPVELEIQGMPALRPRLASPIGAPDLLLFPARYAARSVVFHAGLELRLLHRGLWLLSHLVSAGFVRSLGPLSPMLKRIADRLKWAGSDRGGMIAYAVGRDASGRLVRRSWTLVAEAGDGPEIPPTPAVLMAKKLLAGGDRHVGASPAVGMLTIEEVEAGLSHLAVRCATTEQPAETLMQAVLGDRVDRLPAAIQRLAEVHDVAHFRGEASVERGTGLLSRVIGRLVGFPPATDAVEVEVTKAVTATGETWTRRFGDRSFVSHLSHRSSEAGILRERFGPMSFSIALTVDGASVRWPVVRWRYLGLPMPSILRPTSDTVEYVDESGRFMFRVEISLPVVGLVVRYKGWLEPSQAESSTPSPDFAPISMHA